MNEVKPVSDLIAAIVGLAISLGAIGTLYDVTKAAKKDAARAISDDQISYSKWNSTLQDPLRAKRRTHINSN